MNISTHNKLWRPTGAAVIASLILPTLLAGCGSPAPQAQAPMQRQTQARPANAGMSTGQKVKLLAGAAAVFYLYKKYQRDNAAKLQQASATAPGGKIQYFRSKSQGFIYYRDAQGKAIIVAPAPDQVQQVRLPEAQAQEYSKFQGYDGAQGGETLDKYFPVR